MTSTEDAGLISWLHKAVAQYAKAKLKCGHAAYVWDADAVLHAEEQCDKALKVVNEAISQAAARIEALSKERDTARLNWLENMTVNVRVPLVYGSRDLFWATPGEEKGEISDLRAKVDKHAAFQKDTTHGPL